MKKLFLVSSFKDASVELPLFEKELQGKRITFITTASKVEKVVFYVKSGRQALENLGLIIDELDISIATFKQIEEKVRNNDFIYVAGGNSFFLLQELKKSGADKIIIEEINKGKLYIGESAGAVVLLKKIDYIQTMDSPKKALELLSFEGLDVIDFQPLPHFNNSPFSEITQKIIEEYGETRALCPFNNQQVILVEDHLKKIITVK